jgi:dCTP deaminase
VILSGGAILEQMQAERLSIDPFDEAQLNPNSYNMTLSPELGVYVDPDWDPKKHFSDTMAFPAVRLDCRKGAVMFGFEIPESGMLLHPGKLYLGSTVETTATDHYVPMIEGRSSLARLGLSVHQTGGFGDIGFHGAWTLEFTCVEPIRIYAGMQICQVQFWEITGPILSRYRGKYAGQQGPTPSRLYKELNP